MAAWTAVLAVGGPLLLPQVLHLLHHHYGQVHQGDSSICMITAMIHLLHFGCKLAESVKRGMEI